jgi:hypothetical protein
MGKLQTLAATALEVPEELCPFTLTAVGSAVPSGNRFAGRGSLCAEDSAHYSRSEARLGLTE